MSSSSSRRSFRASNSKDKSPTSTYSYTSQSRTSDQLTSKGINDLDWDKISKLITTFKSVHHHRITDLTGEAARNFRYFHEAAGIIGVSPEGYHRLYNLVRTEFGDLSYHQLVPGSVGAYFAGSLVEPTNYDGPIGCSAIQAGSLVNPHDRASQTSTLADNCLYTVVLASYHPNGYYNVRPRSVVDSNKAIIHVLDLPNHLTDIPPFSDKEKAALAKDKIEEVLIFRVERNDQGSLQHRRVTSDFVALNQLPSRTDNLPLMANSAPTSNRSATSSNPSYASRSQSTRSRSSQQTMEQSPSTYKSQSSEVVEKPKVRRVHRQEGSGGVGWLLLIPIILIILVLVYFWLRPNRH